MTSRSTPFLSCSLHFPLIVPLLFFFFIQAWNFLSRLPVINVGISVKGSWDDLVEGHNELSISTLTADKRDENKWIKLHADQEYVLQVSLQRVHFGLPKVVVFGFHSQIFHTKYLHASPHISFLLLMCSCHS